MLDEDEVGMLWLYHLDARGRRMAFYLLTAILKIGWRIVDASPEEQVLLDAHGLASGRIQ